MSTSAWSWSTFPTVSISWSSKCKTRQHRGNSIIDLLRCSVKRESRSAVETFFFPAKNLQAASKDPQHAVDFSIGRGTFSLTRGANTPFHNGEQLSYLIPPPTLKNGSSPVCKDS